MFILIPCFLILVSIAGMVIIVRRKLPYLRKLSPESHEVGDSIVHDFFPELMEWLQNIPWHEYQQVSLRELEKALRRMRLAFLKIDHASARLIQKIRHTHQTTQIEQTLNKAEENTEVLVPQEMALVDENGPEALKAQEQQLIIQIAQDPKNPELYETLGDLYMKMESFQDAKEAYEAGLGFAPDNIPMARKYSALLKKNEAAV